MRKIQLILVIVVIGIVTAIQFPQQSMARDWAYQFVVWEKTMYIVSDEHVTDIETEIGQVTKYSDMEQHGGNFSNAYPKGTKYYSIKGVDPNKAIAVQVEKDVYLKAESNGTYEYKENGSFNYLLVSLGILAVIAVVVIFFINRKR